MNNDLAIILTARQGSTRLPGKALKTIRDQPLIYWIIRRLMTIGNVCLATTEEPNDDALASYVRAMDVPVYRGSTNDVMTRMDQALQYAYPEAKFVLRGLGDCPFMAGELITRAVDVMSKYDGDAFVWALPPHVLPVYGSREFPYSRSAWNKIVINSYQEEREHIDMFFHKHRLSFNTLYHEPPGNIYFRPYRLEVDWEEDLKLITRIMTALPPTAAVPDIITYLDNEPSVAQINIQRVEITGPSRVSQAQRRKYFEWMKNKPIYMWDGSVLRLPRANDQPVFCNSGACLLGYASQGVLYRVNGDRITDGTVICNCGIGKMWHGVK